MENFRRDELRNEKAMKVDTIAKKVQEQKQSYAINERE